MYYLKLKEARKNKNISQKELAKQLNTAQQVISDYEVGKKTPSLDRLVELAQILDVTLDELVEFKRIHSAYSKNLSKIK